MPILNKVVRSIITHPPEIFFEGLKETIDHKLNLKIDEKYKQSLYSFFSESKTENKIEKISENVVLIKEKEIKTILSNLKESHFESKTILHKFRDGNTVAINPEDSFSLIQMHDSLNIINQEKMRNLMSESFTEYNKILKFSKKHRKGQK